MILKDFSIRGQMTRYVYDKANQLVSSTVDGQETLYRYDAAGRLVQEGNKTYVYGYQDKILSVKENGKVAATFDYYLNGQLASVTRGSETETFYWDGLALVARGQTRYLNEPHAGGGAPVLASGKTLFNDLLGNTLGVQEGGTYTPVKMTAFGETKTKEAFFTGKPFIGELGYAFLLRNYRPNQGKWQTADPLGYPDGWNNFAYGNNRATEVVDLYGGSLVVVSDLLDALRNYSVGNGNPAVVNPSLILRSVGTKGFYDRVWDVNEMLRRVSFSETSGAFGYYDSFLWTQSFNDLYYLVLGRTTIRFSVRVDWTASPWLDNGDGTWTRNLFGRGDILLSVSDDWDFTAHNPAPFTPGFDWNLFLNDCENEYGPQLVAELFSIVSGNLLGSPFYMYGSANVDGYEFFSTQIKE